MNDTIELAIESPDGIIDCQLEPQRDEDEVFYAATILYPHMVNGYSRSEIYCHNLKRNRKTGQYHFDSEDIHPKVKRLEAELSAAITGQ